MLRASRAGLSKASPSFHLSIPDLTARERQPIRPHPHPLCLTSSLNATGRESYRTPFGHHSAVTVLSLTVVCRLPPHELLWASIPLSVDFSELRNAPPPAG